MYQIKLSNGHEYQINKRNLKYEVMCTAPEEKVGLIDKRRVNLITATGDEVFEYKTYWTLGLAVTAMEEHAGLRKKCGHHWDQYAACA